MSSPHALIEASIQAELSAMHADWERASVSPSHDPFLAALAPDLALASRQTRQLTSRIGVRMARIARHLAVQRYGKELVPNLILGPGVEAHGLEADPDDTIVLTRVPKRQAEEAASRLVQKAKQKRIGSPAFAQAFARESVRLHALKRQETPWRSKTDLVVLAPGIGFCELKTGGALDSSNAPRQIHKMVKAALVSGNPEAELHLACAYANQGEGNPIKGELPKYLLTSEQPGKGGLLVGREWWERVLPPEVSYWQFMEIFAQVAARYPLRAPSLSQLSV